MSINEFIKDLEDPKSKIKKYFSNPDDLIISLKELNSMIGMRKIKVQILKQIKTFVSSKAKKIYKEKDRKHCLLCGPPGCGKTTVGKILCKIWISIGFIGADNKKSKFPSFNKMQDEILRRQRMELREYKDKLRNITQKMNNVNRGGTVCKKILNTILSSDNQSLQDKSIIRDITSIISILDSTTTDINKLMTIKQQNYKGMEIEADKNMEETREDPDIPFHVYNRNDVVSRYVGDTAHRCTKAMNEALDGVAYFDEAYNLCNDSGGFSDSYGRVALTTINQFMDEHSDRLIVVFAGYKEEIYNNLFKIQKGLESRFTNKFEIDEYTSEELTKIFIQRLEESQWNIDESPQLHKMIKDNLNLFKFQGRDMDTLALYTKNVISERIYNDVIEGKQIPNRIADLDIVKTAIEIFKQNSIKYNRPNPTDLERVVNLLRN